MDDTVALVGVFAAGVLGAAVLSTIYVPAEPAVAKVGAKMSVAGKYKLTKPQIGFFKECQGVLHKKAANDPTAARLQSLYPGASERYCGCLVQTIGTPSDSRVHGMTRLLIKVAIEGRGKLADKKLQMSMQREAMKAMWSGGSRDQMKDSLKRILKAQRSCVRVVQAVR